MRGLILFGRKRIVELERKLKDAEALLNYDERVIEELKTMQRNLYGRISNLWKENDRLKKAYKELSNEIHPRDSKGRFIKKTK